MTQSEQGEVNEYPGRRVSSGYRVRACPSAQQVPAGARRAEAPERTVYHNSATSNEPARLPPGHVIHLTS